MIERDGDGARPAAEIGGAFVPIQGVGVTAVELDGEAVALAEGAASAFFLDELATLVWNTFDGSATIDQLAEDFAHVFAADVEVVRGDILKLARDVGRAACSGGSRNEPPSPPSHAWPSGVSPASRSPVELADRMAKRLDSRISEAIRCSW